MVEHEMWWQAYVAALGGNHAWNDSSHDERETLDRLDAYAQQREAEWSRGMDCEQAIAEPDERCTVTIWELQQLIVEARRTVPGLVQYNALMAERDTARREREEAVKVLRSVEWAGSEWAGDNPHAACPCCGAAEDSFAGHHVHAPGCALAAALKGTP